MRDDYGIAAVTGDVMLAADALSDDTIQRQIYVWYGMHKRFCEYELRADADFCHSILRLLAAMRDKRAAEFRQMKRAIRKAEGVEPARA